MLSLTSIKAQRYHLFRDETEVEFRPGVSLVTGKNKSGKSLLFSVIPTLLSLGYDGKEWESPPKGSKLQFDFSKDKTPFSLHCTTNASSSFNIAIDNADMKPHKKSDAQALLLKNWTIPKPLFQATVFLRGVDKHPLSMGTPGTRSQWLAQALDITTVYDSYKMEVDRVLEGMSKAFNTKETLKNELEKVSEKIPTSTIGRKRGEKADRLLKKYQEKLSKLPKKKSELEHHVSLIEKIDSLPDISLSKDYTGQIKALQKEIIKYEDILEDLESFEEDSRQNKKIAKQIEERVERFPDIAVAMGMGSLEKHLKKLSAKFDAWADAAKDYKLQLEEYEDEEELRSEQKRFRKFQPKSKNLGHAKDILAVIYSKKEENENRLESLTSTTELGKECPTCGSILDRKHLKKEISRVRLAIDEVEPRIRRAKEEIAYWECHQVELKKKPKPLPFTREDYIALRDEVKAFMEADSLQANLVDLPKIPKDVSSELKEAKKNLVKLEKKQQAITSLKNLYSFLPENLASLSRDALVGYMEDSKAALSAIEEEIYTLQQMITKWQSVKSKFDTERTILKQYQSHQARLSGEIKELDQETRDYDAYKALSMAFGNSGVRLYHLNETAKVLSAKLTELSALFFDTTYKFDIEVSPHKLNIRVERNGIVGSLNTLSGSETRSWNLLCAMALLRILPAHMRCDTILLDEIEANMDHISREKYTQEVIPELQTLVPKIVVITPLINGELSVDADYRYSVLKEYHKGEYRSKFLEG